MIRGARYWNDTDRYYLQTNNAFEAMLRRYGADVTAVTCGPTAAVTCLDALGHPILTSTYGSWQPQPEDMLSLWFHDQRNWNILRATRAATDPSTSEFSPHEVPQYYPDAVEAVFGAKAEFLWINKWETLTRYLKQGHAIQLCFASPGHYVSAVAYDIGRNEIIYHDSYPERDGKSGFARRLGHDYYSRNVQPFAIVYEASA